MKAKTSMTREIIFVEPQHDLKSAYELMRQYHVRHLPVLEDFCLVGILSDRDVLLYASEQDDQLEVPPLPIKDVMSEHLITCRLEDSVSVVASLMLSYRIDAVPVTDENGRLRGLITSSDLLELLIRIEEQGVLDPLPFEFELINICDLEAMDSQAV